MNDFDELVHFFRKPKYPVIVDIEGVLVAAKSVRLLYTKLLRLDLVEKQSYEAIEKTGEPWTLIVMQRKAVLSPINFKKQPTKLELIRRFNNRKNKPADDVDYSEKSVSSKKRERIITEIADRLIDADKRNASNRTR
ncbi:hypothetical protein [Rhodopirellula sallentina]|uniref:Uncharacterized protein n=1 Tax=Rhodopirellula sallentina SM41 TaxID=1263870 RepID=M5TTT8_9BACT|nr:hypothetical protein [Rhodopirellula sallentina]EMI52469.1 hypothetical protein RSSM_06092 [Rhodopirellula sallentina SM41]